MKDQTIKVNKKFNNFVQIDNNIFSDKRMSFKAKGILSYLLSKPENWTVRVKDLYNHTTEGISSIRSGMEELILAGYMELRTRYDRDGKEFHGRRIEVYEEPLFSEGWRTLENKNKNYVEGEKIVLENPRGNRKMLK